MHFKVIVCAIVVLGMVQKTVRQNTQPAATGSSGGVIVVVDPTTRQIRQATPAEIRCPACLAVYDSRGFVLVEGAQS